MKIKKKKQEQGFTLLEVMVAMSILSIGILAIMGLQYILTLGVAHGNVTTNELYLASIVMERKYMVDNEKKDITLTNVSENSEDAGGYNVNATVSEPFDGYSARLITVTVSRGNAPTGRNVVLRTLTKGADS